MPISDFSVSTFRAGEISHSIYRKGNGPAIVLMHELPGMSKPCIAFAEELASAGFSVHMPLLFGEPEDHHTMLFTVKLCITREFRLFAQRGDSPIVGWLRALCRQIRAENGGKGVGVIGMCLTGNFAISLMADDAILAPVASQPALPLGLTAKARAALAVPSKDLATAKQRNASGVPLLCLRFSNDCISPKERFDAIRSAFSGNFEAIEINSSPGNPHGVSTNAHSVLTDDFVNQAGHPTRIARDRVIEFMKQHLS